MVKYVSENFTCYNPVHLLQGSCQHVAGIRHHLQSLINLEGAIKSTF